MKKLSISFPHVGSFTYVFESIVQEMNRKDVIVPTKPTYKTKQLGSRHASEFVCTPFKIMLGSFIEVVERGAYELIGTVFVDYCRLGYYTPLYKIILEDMGYDFDMIYLDFSKPIEFFKNMKTLTNGLNYLQAFQAFRVGYIKNRHIDLVDRYLYSYGAIEISKGTTRAVAEKAYRLIVETRGMNNIRKLPKIIKKMFEEGVEIDKTANPLKVAIIGELYAVVEPAINLDVMRRLNELGVIAYTPITFTRWIDFGMKARTRLNPFKKEHFQTAVKKAKPYLEYRLGGKAQESIGDTIWYKEMGWDGVVHLYPFTCMPEIISRSILPQISKDYKMPALSLVVDEHTGEAGFQTRLEAFVDLLERKRE